MSNPLDLDPIALSIYETLIGRQPSSVEELQSALLLPAPSLHQGLESLEAMGMVSRVPGSPARYGAIAPDIALEVLFLQREEEIKRARRYAEELSIRFQQAAAGRDPAELVEILTGIPAIRQRWEQLQRGTKAELRGIDKPPYTVTEKSSQTEIDLLAQGIKYRIIYDTSGLDYFPDWAADIERSIGQGEQARVASNVPTKLVIFDDRYAMIPLQVAPSTMATMILVHRSGLLEALCGLFESLWAQALPFPVASSREHLSTPDRPTPDEARLLAMLVTGVQDEVIARRLGMSYRTFQRRLQDLMKRLGAETRFQAGLRAAARGWVSPS
ncbi:MAG TPA: hypothetical protein DGG94_04140 [Micromonosporaceae bacterium]|nr:hypothetical protein [Micromonosporaceae bacterium]HCU48989.1 hypothetical protein [Micromonosporaceae bacterium]